MDAGHRAVGHDLLYGSAFPDWQGDLILSGLQSHGLVVVDIDGTSAHEIVRWDLGGRVRDVTQAPDGSLWVLYDQPDGRLVQLLPASGTVVRTPTDLSISSGSVTENAPAGTIVGTVTGADASGGALVYSLTNTAEGLFAIDATTGVVTTTRPIDFETTPHATIVARVTDGDAIAYAESIDISVTDVLEPLTGTSGNDQFSVSSAAADIDGNGGYDIVTLRSPGFTGSPTVTFAANGDLVVQTSNPATLRNVEEVAIQTASFSGTIYTPYLATIFAAYASYAGRAPDTGEFVAWSSAMIHSGATAATIRTAILNDPAGKAFVDAQITSAYQTYAGRAPSSIELTNWEGTIRNAGNDFSVVQKGILTDPLGKAYVDAQINAAYQTYAGRAATSIELTNWEGTIRTAGNDMSVVKTGILTDPLGKTYVDAQINAAYQTYAGRAATSIEIANWEGTVKNAHGDIGVVKTGILTDPLGKAYVDAQITSAYQTYAGRAPVAIELTNWEGTIQAAHGDVGVVRTGILTDPLGKAYVDAQITSAYQTYAGRAPASIELTNWEGTVRNAGNDMAVVRNGILNDQLGLGFATARIDALYQRYDGRAATVGEQTSWKANLLSGADFDTVRDALLSDSGSAATATQLSGTAGADTFHFAAKPYLTLSGFDPAHDLVDLQGLGFSSINPLDAAHARDVHQLDGTNDVFIALDATHEILLHNVSLTQLSGGDFLL